MYYFGQGFITIHLIFNQVIEFCKDYNDPYSSWEPAKFVKTRFSSALLLDKKGYVYKTNSKNGSKTYWVCRNHLKDKNNKCLARATTDGNYVTYWKGVHNHPTNILQSDVILEN